MKDQIISIHNALIQIKISIQKIPHTSLFKSATFLEDYKDDKGTTSAQIKNSSDGPNQSDPDIDDFCTLEHDFEESETLETTPNITKLTTTFSIFENYEIKKCSLKEEMPFIKKEKETDEKLEKILMTIVIFDKLQKQNSINFRNLNIEQSEMLEKALGMASEVMDMIKDMGSIEQYDKIQLLCNLKILKQLLEQKPYSFQYVPN